MNPQLSRWPGPQATQLRRALVAPVRPVLRVLQSRIDTAVREGGERQATDLREIAAQLRAEQATEAALQHRLRDERLGELAGRVDDLDDQLRRISAQLVSLEQRVGDLERPAVEPAGSDADRREARSLVDEVRREHGRARAELATVAFYEERLARLEEVAGPRGTGVG